MPAVLAPTPSDAPVGQQKKGQADQVAAVPFARSSKWHIEQGNITSGIVVNTAVPGTFNFTLPSYGYLSAVYITLLATGGTGTAAVYFEDAPWSILQNILLTDVNGVPIYGPISGYSAYLAAKYGGYRMGNLDPELVTGGSYTSAATRPDPILGQAPTYGPALASVGNTPIFNVINSGNFVALLPIFFEFGRDGLGGQPAEDKPAVSVDTQKWAIPREPVASAARDAVTTTRRAA